MYLSQTICKYQNEGEVYNHLVGWEWKMKRKSSSPMSLRVDPTEDLASLKWGYILLKDNIRGGVKLWIRKLTITIVIKTHITKNM